MCKSQLAAVILAVMGVVVHAFPVAAAGAQENPFVGTWSTSLMLPNGAGYAAYLDFYSEGTAHMSGLVTGGNDPSRHGHRVDHP
jgi:hypothetical protein